MNLESLFNPLAKKGLDYVRSVTYLNSLFLQISNNLSDLANVATARTNLSVLSEEETKRYIFMMGR